MADYYPPVGFHFVVAFELPTVTTGDFQFQEVSGLSVSLETETLVEGGENRFTYELPTRTKYDHLVLKRGMLIGSVLFQWAKEALENFNFIPTNLIITLLNENHIPITAWYVVNAYPVKWSVTDLNAEQSSIVIESLELNYNYFKILKL
ncbi:MAG: phage tail protein [Bacteroidota bacterium]